MPDADEITTPAVSLPVSPEQLELQTLLGEMRNDFLFYIKACDPAYIVSKVHVYLTQRLQEVADGRCKRLIISIPPRIGKALAVDTPIATPSGWTTMGELKVGDYVFDEAGNPVRVKWISEVFKNRPVFEVSTKDGEKILADEAHEWVVRLCRKYKKRSIYTTKYLARRQCSRAAMIDVQGALEIAAKNLPIDPYILGVWLGAGDSRDTTITSADAEIIEKWAEFVRGCGCSIRVEQRGQEKTKRYSATNGQCGGKPNAVRDLFRGLNVLNKHIPEEYLFSSKEQRLALLQGLIDTDGYVAKNGRIEFCSTNKNLADGVQYLANSLGVKASMIVGKAKLYGRVISDKYRVFFFLKDAALLTRKRILTRNGVKFNGRFARFSQSGVADTKCIQVEAASGMFLCGKSLLPTHNSRCVTTEFTTWLLGRNPKENIVIASYSQELVNDRSREARARIRDSEIYRSAFPKTVVNDNDARVNNWGTTEGGRFQAVSVGAGLTGRSASILILDDLVKDFEEAHSEVVQERIFNWLQSVAMTRLFPGSPIVFIMTRWSTTDPVARILDPEFQARLKDAGIEDSDKWEVVNIPAVCEDPETDLIGRAEGESIFPERFSEKEFAKIKAERGSFVWASLYCGRPVALGGNYIKVDRIRTVQRADVPKDLPLFRYWDLAATEKKTSDYTVGVLGGIDHGLGVFYIVDLIRGRWEWPYARDMIKRAALQDKARIGVEAVAGFKTAFSNLIEVLPSHISCSEFGADKDKMTRALPWMAMVENYKVCIVQADWNIDLLLELGAFPRGKHDDIVDAISGCCQMARSNIQYIMQSSGIPRRFGQSDRGNRSLIG